MDKATFVYALLEGIIFMIPITTLFVKLGRYTQRIDSLEKKVERFENIESRLSTIESKIDLLLEGKIKLNE